MKKDHTNVAKWPVPGHGYCIDPGAADRLAAASVNSRAIQTDRIPIASSSPAVAEILELPLRESAEKLIVQAMETELRVFRAQFRGLRDAQGREMLVRNGFHPARILSTAIGRITVRIPKLRRRDGGRVAFRSLFIPHYVRRADEVQVARQCDYLKSIRERDVALALDALFNGRIRYVPSPVMTGLRVWWPQHCEDMLLQFSPRGFDTVDEVWADALTGVCAKHGARVSMLALVGIDKSAQRRFLSLAEFDHSSAMSWIEVLRGLKRNGLRVPSKVSVSARAVGFAEACSIVFQTDARAPRDSEIVIGTERDNACIS